MAKGEAARIILWMCWVTQWLISSIYVALALITFAKLWEASAEVFVDTADLVKNKIWRAPMASCLLSALLVIGFDLMSCITLIKKSINRAGPGFGYGFIVAFCFSLSSFLLLCGLVLDGFKKVVVDVLEQPGAVGSWTKYSSDLYMGTFVFAIITFCSFLLFGIALMVLQSGMSDHLGIEVTPKQNPGYGPPSGYDPYSNSAFNSAQVHESDMDAESQHTQEHTSIYQGGPGSSVMGPPGYQNVVASDYQDSNYYQGLPPQYGAFTPLQQQQRMSPQMQMQPQGQMQPARQQQQYGYMGAPSTFGHAGYGYASLAAVAPGPAEPEVTGRLSVPGGEPSSSQAPVATASATVAPATAAAGTTI